MTSCCSYNPTYCSCWCCFWCYLLLCSVWFRCVVLTTCCSYSPTYCSCLCFFLCDLLLCYVWFRYVVLTTCCSYIPTYCSCWCYSAPIVCSCQSCNTKVWRRPLLSGRSCPAVSGRGSPVRCRSAGGGPGCPSVDK